MAPLMAESSLPRVSSPPTAAVQPPTFTNLAAVMIEIFRAALNMIPINRLVLCIVEI